MRPARAGGARATCRELAAYALFGVTANSSSSSPGWQRTTATNAVVIGATIPVFTVGVAVVLRKEAATLAKLLGLAVACVGAMVIVGGGALRGRRRRGSSATC